MCTLTITSVTGTGSGTPTTITVAGTAADCDEVRVTLVCTTGLQITRNAPAAGGAWTVTFTAADGLAAAGCRCRGDFRVVAECVGDSACTAERSGIVDCGQDECPSVLVNASVDPDCAVDLTRTVTLNSVHFGAAAPTAQWAYGDAASGTPFVLTGGVIHSETHDYTPGSYTATLQVAGCPPVSVAVAVDPCPCPELLIMAAPDDTECDGGLMDVALSVSNPSPVTLVCEWEFTPGIFSGSFPVVGPAIVTRHFDYAPGTHTATLTVVGCPTKSVTFTVPPCPPPDDDDDGGGGGGLSFCGALCVAWALLLAAYLVGIATGTLADPAVLAAATAVLVAFSGLFIALCGACAYARCTLVGLGLFLLVLLLLLLLSVALPGLVAAGAAALGFLTAALLILRLAC